MFQHLARGSSDIDWCEANYDITPGIAEFYNTISNVLFFIIPPFLIYLFQQYACQVTKGVQLIWILLFVVGLGSAYFHATLSLFGQLLDELAILWVIMAAFSLWFPKRMLPSWFAASRRRFHVLIFVLGLLGTALACIKPAVNAFVLMIFGIPSVWLLIGEIQRCHCRRAVRLGIRSALIWMLALLCWLTDRLFCDIWTSVRFPYLHCGWHLCVFISSYTGCVLFSYFHAQNEFPEQMPTLKFWPSDTWETLGVPYVILKRKVDAPLLPTGPSHFL